MRIDEQIADAMEDFQGLVSDGWETEAALSEAANSNGVTPAALRLRIERSEEVECVVERIRLRKRTEDFRRAVVIEAREFWETRPTSAGLGYIFNKEFIVSKVGPAVEKRLGRVLTPQELNRITDLYPKIVSGEVV